MYGDNLLKKKTREGELINFGDILHILSESISKSREKSGEKLKFMNIKLMIKSLTEALKLGVSMSDKSLWS